MPYCHLDFLYLFIIKGLDDIRAMARGPHGITPFLKGLEGSNEANTFFMW